MRMRMHSVVPWLQAACPQTLCMAAAPLRLTSSVLQDMELHLWPCAFPQAGHHLSGSPAVCKLFQLPSSGS